MGRLSEYDEVERRAILGKRKQDLAAMKREARRRGRADAVQQIAEPTERDRQLRGWAFSESPLARLSDDEYTGLNRRTEIAIAQAREEGRQEGLKIAIEVCQDGIASELAKSEGYKSWDAELCIIAIEAKK